MATPLHAHPSDGSFYPDCARCRLERAAPNLLKALKRLLVKVDEQFANSGVEDVWREQFDARVVITTADPPSNAVYASPEYRVAVRLLDHIARIASVQIEPIPSILSDLVDIMHQEDVTAQY